MPFLASASVQAAGFAADYLLRACILRSRALCDTPNMPQKKKYFNEMVEKFTTTWCCKLEPSNGEHFHLQFLSDSRYLSVSRPLHSLLHSSRYSALLRRVLGQLMFDHMLKSPPRTSTPKKHTQKSKVLYNTKYCRAVFKVRKL